MSNGFQDSFDRSEDLRDRLYVFPIKLPPLRKRREDVDLLARTILAELNESNGTSKESSSEVMQALEAGIWEGNVRHLRDFVERICILADDVIEMESLNRGRVRTSSVDSSRIVLNVGESIGEVERKLILATLSHTDGDKNRAVEFLGISLGTLHHRLSSY